jgi:hypothetical protein
MKLEHVDNFKMNLGWRKCQTLTKYTLTDLQSEKNVSKFKNAVKQNWATNFTVNRLTVIFSKYLCLVYAYNSISFNFHHHTILNFLYRNFNAQMFATTGTTISYDVSANFDLKFPHVKQVRILPP